MNNKLNELMAMDVMGWHLGTWLHKNDAWYSDSDDSEIPDFECYVHTEEKARRFTTWNPTEDIAQAIRCVEKLELDKIKIYAMDVEGLYKVTLWLIDHNSYTVKANTKEKAICEAISEAIGGEG